MKEMVEFVEWLKDLVLREAWNTISIYKAGDRIYCYVDGGLEQEVSLSGSSEEEEEEAEGE